MSYIIVAAWIAVVKFLLPLIAISSVYGLVSFLFWTWFVVSMLFYLSIISLFTSGKGTQRNFDILSGGIDKHLSDVRRKNAI